MATRNPTTIYADMIAAGILVDNHESDLYVPDTKEAREILAKHGNTSATVFLNEAPPHVGERWIDIPFMFEPFWKTRD